MQTPNRATGHVQSMHARDSPTSFSNKSPPPPFDCFASFSSSFSLTFQLSITTSQPIASISSHGSRRNQQTLETLSQELCHFQTVYAHQEEHRYVAGPIASFPLMHRELTFFPVTLQALPTSVLLISSLSVSKHGKTLPRISSLTLKVGCFLTLCVLAADVGIWASARQSE